MKYTEKEFKQALKNLEGAYFFKRDITGKIIGVSEEPTMEMVLEEIKMIRLMEKAK